MTMPTPFNTSGTAQLTGTAPLSPADISRIIEMAWADEIPFDSIRLQYGLNEPAVIALMRREMKASSFRMWRKRVTGRTSKHKRLSDNRDVD